MDLQEPDSSPDVSAAESEEEHAPELEQESVPESEEPVAEFVDGQEHAVDPASMVIKRVIGMTVVLGIGGVVLLILTLAWASGGMPSWLYRALLVGWGTPVVGFAYLTWQWPALHHRHLRYRVDTSGVRIRRGVLWRKIISIPTTRVQHTDVTQGPLQRGYGLATLTVHTAGTEGASIALSGLSHEVALRLRDHLLPGDRDGT